MKKVLIIGGFLLSFVACQGQDVVNLRDAAEPKVAEKDESGLVERHLPPEDTTPIPEPPSQMEKVSAAEVEAQPFLEGQLPEGSSDELSLTMNQYKTKITGGVCMIHITGDCKRQVTKNAWFIDTHINTRKPNSGNYAYHCARRAIDYKNWCGKRNGRVIARASGSNGKSVQHITYPHLSCKMKATLMDKNNKLVEKHFDDAWGEVVGNAHLSNSRCADRAKEHRNWFPTQGYKNVISVTGYRFNPISKRVYGIWTSGSSVK